MIDGSGANGNWELAMIEAMLGIAVFTENWELFNHSTGFWNQRFVQLLLFFFLRLCSYVLVSNASLGFRHISTMNLLMGLNRNLLPEEPLLGTDKRYSPLSLPSTKKKEKKEIKNRTK